MVIPIPEIKTFEVSSDHDFIVVGCDGIFDKMNNADTVKSVWKSVKDLQNLSIHEQCCEAVDYVIKNSLLRKTQDNVTSLVIAFEGLTQPRVEIKRETHSLSPDAREPLDVPASQRSTPRKHDYDDSNDSFVVRRPPQSVRPGTQRAFDFTRFG